MILRGIEHCEEIDKPNHRVHCCYTNHCNKQQPKLVIQTKTVPAAKGFITKSNAQRHISSIILVAFTMILQYVLLN